MYTGPVNHKLAAKHTNQQWCPPPLNTVGLKPCYSTGPGTAMTMMIGMGLLTTILIFMSSAPVPTPNRLHIWQQNLNKSRVVQEDLINSKVYKQFDMLILQEPFIDSYGNTKATCNWRVIGPTLFLSCSHVIRSVILVRSSMDTNWWAQISVPSTRDVAAIQICARLGKGHAVWPLHRQSSLWHAVLAWWLSPYPQGHHQFWIFQPHVLVWQFQPSSPTLGQGVQQAPVYHGSTQGVRAVAGDSCRPRNGHGAA